MRWKQWYAHTKNQFSDPPKIDSDPHSRHSPITEIPKVRSWPRTGPRARSLRAVATHDHCRRRQRSRGAPARNLQRGSTKFKAATKLKISNRRRRQRRRRRDELFGAAAAAADASRAPQWNDGTPSQVTSWIEADEFQRAVLRWQNERTSSAGGPS